MTAMANIGTPVTSHMKTISLACTGILEDHPLLLRTTLTSTRRMRWLLEDGLSLNMSAHLFNSEFVQFRLDAD